MFICSLFFAIQFLMKSSIISLGWDRTGKMTTINTVWLIFPFFFLLSLFSTSTFLKCIPYVLQFFFNLK